MACMRVAGRAVCYIRNDVMLVNQQENETTHDELEFSPIQNGVFNDVMVTYSQCLHATISQNHYNEHNNDMKNTFKFTRLHLFFW